MSTAKHWENPVEELRYHEKLLHGICPECNNNDIRVETSHEYVEVPVFREGLMDPDTILRVPVKHYFTIVRCQKCKKIYLPIQLVPTS